MGSYGLLPWRYDMQHTPKFITFTGVDQWTDPTRMTALGTLYPIEWGILFSPKRQGLEPRYPDISAVLEIISKVEARSFAAHLCGADARQVIAERRSQHDTLLGELFDRVQINTNDPDILISGIAAWAWSHTVRPILQCRSSFPEDSTVAMLFDASGGRGIEPAAWPPAPGDDLCGYAGGLNPENVAQHVATIGAGASNYWIDMESGVRDEHDRFSLDKCQAVCEAVYGVRSAL